MTSTTTQQLEAVQTGPFEGSSTPTDSPRYLIPLIMLIAFAIRMVVVYFYYRDLADVVK